MAWGRRCDLGCESWPDDTDYKRCPTCGQTTTRFSNLRPLDEDEARTMKLYAEFEKMYELWCKKRQQPVEGGLPMDEEESAMWDEKYPGGRGDPPEPDCPAS